jgi:hypothetical protein
VEDIVPGLASVMVEMREVEIEIRRMREKRRMLEGG